MTIRDRIFEKIEEMNIKVPDEDVEWTVRFAMNSRAVCTTIPNMDYGFPKCTTKTLKNSKVFAIDNLNLIFERV